MIRKIPAARRKPSLPTTCNYSTIKTVTAFEGNLQLKSLDEILPLPKSLKSTWNMSEKKEVNKQISLRAF